MRGRRWTDAEFEEEKRKALATCIELTGFPKERNGEYYIECPFCHDEDTLAERQFSFSLKGYHCFRGSCDGDGSIISLARYLSGGEDYVPRPIPYREPVPPKPPAWTRVNENHLIDRIIHCREDIDSLWNSYKRVLPETIREFKMGYGKLPRYHFETGEFMWDYQYRLILPHFDMGKLIGLYGRRWPDREGDRSPKWLPANGSQQRVIFGWDRFVGKRPLVIMENRVDSIMAWQTSRDKYDFLALGTARVLRDDEIERIKFMRPSLVVVMLDNDLAGQGTTDNPNVAKQREERIAKILANDPNGEIKIPVGAGFRIGKQLRDARISYDVFPWASDAPLSADAGWLMENGGLDL